MTAILGVSHGGRVYIGGDRSAVDGWNRFVTAIPKVFRVGEFLFGHTGSFRACQVLRYHLRVREQAEAESAEEYIVTGLVQSVRDCLKEHGVAKIESGEETGTTFLLGYRGCLYRVASDYQINEWRCGVDSVGSGSSFALGAYHALRSRDSDMAVEQAIRASLEVAAKLCVDVAEPFDVESV